MSESLKCFGCSGSRFKVWNCASFAWIAGSQCSTDAGGMPQSGTPGIGDGLRRSRIVDNSDRSPDLSSEGVEEVDASAGVAVDDVNSASSTDLERG